MMFCQNCGNSIENGATFCPSCGMNVNGAAPAGQPVPNAPVQYENNSVAQRMQIRQGEMQEMEKMIRYFSQKSAQYDEYDVICDSLSMRPYGKRVGLLVWGIILSIFSFIFFLASFSLLAESGEAALTVMSFISLVGSILMIVGYVLSTRARNNNYQREYQWVCTRFDELTEELYQHYQAYGYCLVSPEYTNPKNLTVIYSTMQSGRADTIKEAVNILVEDAHRNNMEAMARQTAVASAAAARGATAAAVFSAANFFLR